MKRRLEALETGSTGSTGSEWIIPIEVLVHCKAVERYQALRDGKEPPAYFREEVEAMRQWNLETVAGKGVEARLRDSPGWRTPGSQELLDEWEEEARRRLEAAKGLPSELWVEVWGADEEEGAVM
jgi:hypothetical protein